MKRPAFQFYPADWRNNSNLRRCSWAARGAWIDLMCLMHDADGYGVLRWEMKEIAQSIGCPLSLLKELRDKGVLKGCDTGVCEPFVYTPRSGRKDGEPVTLIPGQSGPIWYSSRMVKDEYVRNIRGSGTRFGDPEGADPKVARNASPNHAPKGGFGADFDASPKAAPIRRKGDGPSSSSSSSINTNTVNGSYPPPDNPRAPASTAAEVGVDTPPVDAGAAGQVCRRLRRECGIGDVNPSHPKLLALLAAGAEWPEFAAAAKASDGKARPFAYLLSVIEGERRRAAQMASAVHHGPMHNRQESLEQRNREAAQRWAAKMETGNATE